MSRKKNQNQPKLFEEPVEKIRADFPVTHGAARHTDPETSKVAAAQVNAGDLELAFLRCLYKNGNKTAEEVTNITGIPIDSITPRTAPLQRKQLILPSGEKRPGASGAKRIVWTLTELGRSIVIDSLGTGE